MKPKIWGASVPIGAPRYLEKVAGGESGKRKDMGCRGSARGETGKDGTQDGAARFNGDD